MTVLLAILLPAATLLLTISLGKAARYGDEQIVRMLQESGRPQADTRKAAVTRLDGRGCEPSRPAPSYVEGHRIRRRGAALQPRGR